MKLKPAKLVEEKQKLKPTKLVEDEISKIEESIIEEGVQENLEDDAKTIISEINEVTNDEDYDEEISKNKVLKQIENQEQVTINNEVSKKEIKVIKDLALFDLEQPQVKKILKKPSNLIGLLLPLTGDRRSTKPGLNTFGYSLATNQKI